MLPSIRLALLLDTRRQIAVIYVTHRIEGNDCSIIKLSFT